MSNRTKNPNAKSNAESRARWPLMVMAVLGLLIITNVIVLLTRSDTPAQSTLTGNATVFGKLVQPDGSPIAQAIVHVNGLVEYTFTRDDGTFTVMGVPEGEVELIIGVTPDPPYSVVVTASEGDVVSLSEIVYTPAE
jgi:hypothetical protein